MQYDPQVARPDVRDHYKLQARRRLVVMQLVMARPIGYETSPIVSAESRTDRLLVTRPRPRHPPPLHLFSANSRPPSKSPDPSACASRGGSTEHTTRAPSSAPPPSHRTDARRKEPRANVLILRPAQLAHHVPQRKHRAEDQLGVVLGAEHARSSLGGHGRRVGAGGRGGR